MAFRVCATSSQTVANISERSTKHFKRKRGRKFTFEMGEYEIATVSFPINPFPHLLTNLEAESGGQKACKGWVIGG